MKILTTIFQELFILFILYLFYNANLLDICNALKKNARRSNKSMTLISLLLKVRHTLILII